jgi:3-phosphoshikimate 1-carboxyvinyltransferase
MMGLATGPAPGHGAVGRVIARPLRTARPGEHVWQPHPDKAISQRATLLAALADGESRIGGLADCRDTRTNLGVLSQLGIEWRRAADGAVFVRGADGHALAYRGPDLNVDNSATTARLLIAMLAGSRASCAVTGNSSLRGRPMHWLVAPLRMLGADLRYGAGDGRLPLVISGRPLHGGTVRVDVDSAQAVSALLLGAVQADSDVVIERRTAARDHTERLLRWTGIPVSECGRQVRVTPGRPAAFGLSVPGDPSGAAVLAALHLASPYAGDQLRLTGVCLNPRRLGFFTVIERMGVPVRYDSHRVDGAEPVGDIVIGPRTALRAVTIGGGQLIQSAVDELGLLATLATLADGPTIIRDAAELRDKDTDRIAGMVELLRAFGVTAEARDDGLTIYPSRPRAPAAIRLPPDHRLVFAAFVLAALAEGRTELSGVAASATSYPRFLSDAAHYLDLTHA